jgi:hypothetical protein
MQDSFNRQDAEIAKNEGINQMTFSSLRLCASA